MMFWDEVALDGYIINVYIVGGGGGGGVLGCFHLYKNKNKKNIK